MTRSIVIALLLSCAMLSAAPAKADLSWGDLDPVRFVQILRSASRNTENLSIWRRPAAQD